MCFWILNGVKELQKNFAAPISQWEKHKWGGGDPIYNKYVLKGPPLRGLPWES